MNDFVNIDYTNLESSTTAAEYGAIQPSQISPACWHLNAIGRWPILGTRPTHAGVGEYSYFFAWREAAIDGQVTITAMYRGWSKPDVFVSTGPSAFEHVNHDQDPDFIHSIAIGPDGCLIERTRPNIESVTPEDRYRATKASTVRCFCPYDRNAKVWEKCRYCGGTQSVKVEEARAHHKLMARFCTV